MNKSSAAKVIVREFYDDVGWRKDNERGLFTDAQLFEDLRDASAAYRERADERINELLNCGGELLLDAASGPIQYDSYQRFSDTFRKRVCVDLSFRALTGARKRIGDGGWFVQADITALPFPDNMFDGIVSMHTIYHVPADEQQNAIRELHRTLKPGRPGVVVYNWPRNTLKRILSFPFRLVDSVKGIVVEIPGAWRVIRTVKGAFNHETPAKSDPLDVASSLYFHSHPISWFREEFGTVFPIEVRCWRSVDVPFLRIVPANKRGHGLLRFIRAAEDRFPHLMGRIGAYPLIIIRKTDIV